MTEPHDTSPSPPPHLLPARHSPTNLAKLTRKLLRASQPALAALLDARARGIPDAELTTQHRELCAPFDKVTHGDFYLGVLLDYLSQDFDTLPSEERAFFVQKRAQLLGVLSLSRVRAEQRAERAVQTITQELDFFVGWHLHVVTSSLFQLDEPAPLWHPGEFLQQERKRAALVAQQEDPRDHGYKELGRQRYLDRVRTPIIRWLISQPRALWRHAYLICLFTLDRHQHAHIAHVVERTHDALVQRARDTLNYHSTSLPLSPLYSLPREMRNLSSFYLTKPQALSVRSDLGAVGSPSLENARVKVVAAPEDGSHGQGVLFFDRNLVMRKHDRKDQFLEVRLQQEAPSVLDALIQAIEQLDIHPNVLEHVPRVTAGFFTAAQSDRDLSWNMPGTFWDTSSGRRISRIVGFDYDNKRHRQRIVQVRQLLENIVLHREIVQHNDTGEYIKVKWTGPLLEQRKDQLSVEVGNREGFNNNSTYQAWSIAGALWKMVIPKGQGGTPNFMAIDERAFDLDSSSSVPFNLYWTLLNRAYIQKLTRQGALSVTVRTLVAWSGLEGRFNRPAKLKPIITGALETMVSHGLLECWSCDALTATSRTKIPLAEMLDSTLYIQFSGSHLNTLSHLLPDDAIREPLLEGEIGG